MYDTMTQFPKIHDSLHYNEIVNMLIEGKSGRKISDYLKEEYGETISHTTINKFNKEEVNLKNKVDAKVRRRSKEKVEKEIKKLNEKKVNDEIQTAADIETAVNQGVSEVELMNLMISSGPDIWGKVLDNPNISPEYIMKLILNAVKLKFDRDKDTNNLDINLDTNLKKLGDLINPEAEDDNNS
jgi:hypothetical protein